MRCGGLTLLYVATGCADAYDGSHYKHCCEHIMSIVSNPSPRTPTTPTSTTAPSQKAGDTAELLSQAGGHAHTGSTSSIGSLSLSENVKATGGELEITGKFHAKELVSDEVREKILKGEASSKGPMPGLMESIFQPSPAKVAAQPQRNSFARAWDSIAGGVKNFFKALGQRFTSAPPSQPPQPLQLGDKFKAIRSDIQEGGLWTRFVEHCKNEHSDENVVALTAAEAFLATKHTDKEKCKDAFMMMTRCLYDPDAEGDLSKQLMAVNLPSALQEKVKAARNASEGFDMTAAVGVVTQVRTEVENLLQNDTLSRFRCTDAELALAHARMTTRQN